MKITVLGSGLVGSAMAKDLAKERGWEITVADLSKESLSKLKGEPGITVIQSDLSKPDNIRKVIKDADIVVGAMPGFMGLETLRTIIEASKNVVDISFFPEDPFQLDALAKKHNVTAIVDCGVAPGCSNMLTGYAAAKLDKTDTCQIGRAHV